MDVVIGNKKVSLTKKNFVDYGGEADVFRLNNLAVKVYYKPNSGHSQKLKELIELSPGLPQEVICPQELVFNAAGNRIIGFAMRLLGPGYEVVQKLANKNFRAQNRIENRQVANLFIQAYLTLLNIHKNGLIVGDFNDVNELFSKKDMMFIDVDSFQFGRYKTVTYTEEFIDPSVYRNLSKGLKYTTLNDWYSFAVLLFKSILLAHPYGGTHKKIKSLTERAQKRITVFDKEVKYPKVAYSPDVLTDELAQVFHQYFANGKRDRFPLIELEKYRDVLIECSSCHAFYPYQRKNCPECTVKNLYVIKQKTAKGCKSEEYIKTSGQIIFFKIIGLTLYCLVDEDGKTVLYIKQKGQKVICKKLFKTVIGAKYDFLKDYLVLWPNSGSDELLIIDIRRDSPKGVLKTTSDRLGNIHPVFSCSDRYLYRIAGGTLLRGQITKNQLIEESIAQTMKNQTWFTVSPNPENFKEVIFGFHRIFKRHEYFLISPLGQFEVDILPLDLREEIIDLGVKFFEKTILFLRKTRKAGKDQIKICMIDLKGNILFSDQLELEKAEYYKNIHGQSYRGGIILHPTDEGVIQEKVKNHQQTTFSDTEPFISQSDALYLYQKGLLVVKENQVLYLTLDKS